MRITEHKPHLVEYETENGYISVVRAGNLFAVGIKYGDEELEEFLTDTQASHLMSFISNFVVNTNEDDS